MNTNDHNYHNFFITDDTEWLYATEADFSDNELDKLDELFSP